MFKFIEHFMNLNTVKHSQNEYASSRFWRGLCHMRGTLAGVGRTGRCPMRHKQIPARQWG